jgi:hypothetical protein
MVADEDGHQESTSEAKRDRLKRLVTERSSSEISSSWRLPSTQLRTGSELSDWMAFKE